MRAERAQRTRTEVRRFLLQLCIHASTETSTVYVGTWGAATLAIKFYQRNGFKLVSREEKNKLLKEYWNIPE